MMAAFFSGILFVYSGGGEFGRLAISAKVAGGLPALAEDVIALEQTVADLQAKLAVISDDGTTLTITGRNVQIVSGSGATDDGGSLTGLGNLIVGYNEDVTTSVRTGSHNLIVGTDHDYTSYGGLVAGGNNTISGPIASVSGGFSNTASGESASVSGGQLNTAIGITASVSGGVDNTASGNTASVSGGQDNTASASVASVSGGDGNTASGQSSIVTGGADCTSDETNGWKVGSRTSAIGCISSN